MLRDNIYYDLVKTPLGDSREDIINENELEGLFQNEMELLGQTYLTSPLGYNPDIGNYLLYPLTAPSQSLLISRKIAKVLTFDSEQIPLNSAMDEYLESLKGWSGEGDWTFTEGGATITVYDISVNPSLTDSLFEPN